jgi:hypothetical protein
VPTKSIDGVRLFRCRTRVKNAVVHAVRNDAADERVVAARVLAHADHAARAEGGDQFLREDAQLQHAAADRRRRPRLAERAAVHHAHHRLAGERQQQAVAVRDDASNSR